MSCRGETIRKRVSTKKPVQKSAVLPETAPKTPVSRPKIKKKPGGKRKAKGKTAGKPPGKPAGKPSRFPQGRILPVSLEILGIVLVLIACTIEVLGYSASWFSGTGFFENLLPFAILVVGLIVLAAFFLLVWWRVRKWLLSHSLLLPAVLSVCIALTIGLYKEQDQFRQGFENFRALIGGRQEDRRKNLAHQVYAAYRRYDRSQVQKMIERAQIYAPALKEAAQASGIDENLLQGLAAAESSFIPEESKDGGSSLFQITLVPEGILQSVGKRLAVNTVSLKDPRQNAFVAAAVLKYYLAQMNDDLFLGLLAYNIGPANGGLKFIMKQYGVTNFVTIQPYLQQLPRDYPIRVLSYALAFRLWQQEGKLLAYEEGKNAQHIQQIGIPGFHDD